MPGLSRVAVLFARSDSIYLDDPRCEPWDIDKDARAWAAGMGTPVVAHPPCRAWGRLRGLAKPRPDEKQLAVYAVMCVRNGGGVLEHPAGSTLWGYCGLPLPGETPDAFGGWTLAISQYDFGHRADKPTWLYICGCPAADLPPRPAPLYRPVAYVIKTRCRKGDAGWRPEVTKAEREHTPSALARWLVDIASTCVSPIGGMKL